MNSWVVIGLILAAAIGSSTITYLRMKLRIERRSNESDKQVAEALAAVELEKSKFEMATREIEETVRRKALDEFLADLHVEERHYVREQRVLFAQKKSLILQERIFFRNIPISNWVEHEVPVQEGADLNEVAKTLRVFNEAIEGGTQMPRQSRWIPFRAM